MECINENYTLSCPNTHKKVNISKKTISAHFMEMGGSSPPPPPNLYMCTQLSTRLSLFKSTFPHGNLYKLAMQPSIQATSPSNVSNLKYKLQKRIVKINIDCLIERTYFNSSISYYMQLPNLRAVPGTVAFRLDQNCF